MEQQENKELESIIAEFSQLEGKQAVPNTENAKSAPKAEEHAEAAEPEAIERKLLLREKVQIKVRKATRKKQSVVLLSLIAVVLMALAIVLPDLLPNFSTSTYTKRKDNQVVVMDFVGDVLLGRNIEKIAEQKGYDALFAGVQSYWNDADLVFANLESAVLKSDASNYEERPNVIHLSCTYDALQAACDAGINMWSCSNNHAFDYMARAVAELVDFFEENSITYAGIGRNLSEAAGYTIREVNGYRVAFISITRVAGPETIATETQAGVFCTTYNGYNEIVYEAAQNADITVVYIHWGEENQGLVQDDQTRIAHRLIDAGANVVIGSHPHVLQSAETYRNGVIVYSLGNFIFDQGNTFSRDTAMARLVIKDTGSTQMELIPMRTIDGIPYETSNSFYVKRINNVLTKNLKESKYKYDKDGHIVITTFKVAIEETAAEENGQ